ncbi:putative oxidoreductase [Hyphodiscus hymeniophilus]|uniref:Oxidoreductase n=1 Tax=Hyphodiscus hymeniophilus TaxID=353542 RepID=A0A9P6VJG4_9HELO|nr:putative oxidoreductase [Hyphodiscus hymeniophilus]
MRVFSIFSIALAATPVLSSSPGSQQPILAPASTLSQPSIGFGTWRLTNSQDNTTESVSFAIQTGYRQIDCAAVYGNEKAVGKGIADGLKKANITREQIWVTSKLWNDHHEDPALVEEALKQTLEDLGLDYLDLYLMHWPVGSEGGAKNHLDYVEVDSPPLKPIPFENPIPCIDSHTDEFSQTWRSMIALPQEKVLHVGISNFSPHQLRKIIGATGVKPFAHQMEVHPYLQQTAWLATHQALGIAVTAYSPLGNANPIYGDKGPRRC